MENNPDADCLICYGETLDEDNSFALACGHTFCRDCWIDSIRTSLTTGINNWSSGCPQIGCNMTLGHLQIQELIKVDCELMDRYWKNLCKSYTEEDKQFRYCSNPKCDWYFYINSFSQMTAKCEGCGIETCLTC